MLPFLKEVAQKLYAEYSKNIGRVYVILPTRRACTYFRKYLLETVKEAVICPEILSMDDFIRKISRLHVSEDISLLFTLFSCFKKYDKDKKNNLDTFAPLGTTILKDFNLIERNLHTAKVAKLFESLQEAKAIERWAEELQEAIDTKRYDSIQEYFAFWENLTQTYKDFRELVCSQNKVYTGLAYREVFDKLDILIEKNNIQHIAFAGFNQLNKLDEQMIEKLWKEGKASVFWDVDTYYFSDKNHEAGDYMRHYARWMPPEQMGLQQHIATKHKKIHIYHVSNKISQVKLAGNLLQEELREITHLYKNIDDFSKNYMQTAILLPEENLLLPLLYSLPNKITFADSSKNNFTDCLNVTMGLGIQYTPLFELLQAIFLFQENIRKNKTVYYKHLLKLLKHPYICHICAKPVEQIQENLQADKNIYVSIGAYSEKFADNRLLITLLSQWGETYESAILYIGRLLEILEKNFQQKDNTLECEFLYGFYTALKKLEGSLAEERTQISMKTFKLFLFEAIRHISIPFTGEPISPFQVMGMLESRALDFKKIIILSCNEGILPQGKNIDSVIPFEIRLQHGLPTYKEHDAAYAYTFYRLLHRAEEITLMLHTEPSATSQGYEKSRFILQVTSELARLPNIDLQQSHLVLDLPTPTDISPKVFKSEALIGQIKEKLYIGFSPTSINMYIKDPLTFLYAKILKLKEPFEVDETFEPRTFGVVIHDSLKKLFKPYTGKRLTAEHVDNFLNKKEYIKETIVAAVRERFGKIELNKGKNYILLKIAVQLIRTFLHKQKETAAFYLLAVEDLLSHTLQVRLENGKTLPFSIYGRSDRIDLTGNQIRMVDYKTGTYEDKDLTAPGWQTLLTDPTKEKIIQLVSYKYLLLKALKNGKFDQQLPNGFDYSQYRIVSGFYFFTKISNDFIAYKLKDEPKNEADFIEYAENIFRIFVNDVLDDTKPFTQEQACFRQWVV